MDKAVQTIPPMMSALTIPCQPFNPTATRTTDERINVMRVIPETGFEPTIAMALAATVVNRNEIIRMVTNATTACNKVIFTPISRKINTATNVRKRKSITNDIFRSFWVLSTFISVCAFPPTPNASLKAPPITPEDLMMPIIPAMAMAPMPIGRT